MNFTEMTSLEIYYLFIGVLNGVVWSYVFSFLIKRSQKKEKERRSNVIDMIELKSTVNVLDRRSLTQADAVNKNFDKVQHHLGNVMIQLSKNGSIQNRFKRLEKQITNIETFIKDFSAEDLKRMEDTSERISKLEERLTAHIKLHSVNR